MALAPLLLALDGARRPFLTGFGAGWVAFTGIAWWVYYAMAHFGGIPPFVAVPLMLLMTAIMAAFWGLFAWAHARLRRALPRSARHRRSSRSSGRHPSTCGRRSPIWSSPGRSSA